MARKGAVSIANLKALGADTLAALLMEMAEADASVRKRLVLAVAEGDGSDALIKALDRRLTALATSRSFIDWEKVRAYASEVDGLRRAIAEGLTPLDPLAAAERLERFIRLAPKVLERVDDSSGRIGQVFAASIANLADAWAGTADRDARGLAQRVFDLVLWDQYGVCGDLIGASTSALGDDGMAELDALARTALAEPSKAVMAGASGWRRLTLERVLIETADARGDVDAFIAIQLARGDDRADGLGIAQRLLDANRADDALTWLDRKTGRPGLRIITRADLEARPSAPGGAGLDWERETLRIRALEMTDRRDEAQQVRWRLFEHTLEPDLLRSYLRVLPDFEDDEALERAFALVSSHVSALMALAFLIRWPNLALAAELVMRRTEELDGRAYEVLTPAAEALAQDHPHAATTLNRAMIDSVLERGASKSYPYAARNLGACADLAHQVDWSAWGLEPHKQYLAELRSRHGRKSSFWSLEP